MEWVIGSFLDLIITNDEGGDDLERTINRFASALADGSLPPHAGRVIDELVQASARSPRVQERYLGLYHEVVAQVSKATLKGQESQRIRTDLETSQLSVLLVAMALGFLMLRDAETPLDIDELAQTAKQLLRGSG